MCLYPIRIRNPGYDSISDAQHRSPFADITPYGSAPSPIPIDYELDVPCGKCWQCLRQKRFETVLRLKAEQAVIPPGTRSYFVTLTYDDANLDRFKFDYGITVRRWLDKLRKRYGSFRYWFLSELGDKNGRFHFHGIIFGMRHVSYADLCDSWPYGISWFGYVDNSSCGYVTKYMIKQQVSKHFEYRPIRIASKSIGCGPDGSALEFLKNQCLGYFDPQSPQKPCYYDCVHFPGDDPRYNYAIPRYYFEKLFGHGSSLIARAYRYASRPRYIFRRVAYTSRESWIRAIHAFRNTLSLDYRVRFDAKKWLIPRIRIPSLIQFKFNISQHPIYYGYQFKTG